MNEMIKKLQERRSVREFTGEKVKDEDLKLILETAQKYPNSVHGQQTSLIVIRDKENIRKVAELSGNQEHIKNADVFIMILVDFYRGKYATDSIGATNMSAESADGILVGAVDAGIMLSSIQTAAGALGYGTTAIGAVRSNPEKFIEMFNLPKYVYPIVGTTIGVPAKNELKTPKPRIPLDSFAFDEKYDIEKVKEGVEIFEKEFRNWWDENGMPERPSYKETNSIVYGIIRYNTVKSSMEKQGFKFTDNEE